MLSLRKNALVNIVFCLNMLIIVEFGLGECFIIMAVNRKVSSCQIASRASYREKSRCPKGGPVQLHGLTVKVGGESGEGKRESAKFMREQRRENFPFKIQWHLFTLMLCCGLGKRQSLGGTHDPVFLTHSRKMPMLPIRWPPLAQRGSATGRTLQIHS